MIGIRQCFKLIKRFQIRFAWKFFVKRGLFSRHQLGKFAYNSFRYRRSQFPISLITKEISMYKTNLIICNVRIYGSSFPLFIRSRRTGLRFNDLQQILTSRVEGKKRVKSKLGNYGESVEGLWATNLQNSLYTTHTQGLVLDFLYFHSMPRYFKSNNNTVI